MFDPNNPNPAPLGQANPYGAVLPVTGFPVKFAGQERFILRTTIPNGTTNLYTVPADKKLFFLGFTFNNTSGVSITPSLQALISSVAHKMAIMSAVGNDAQNGSQVNQVLKAGETLQVVSTGAANVYLYGILMNDYVPINTYRLPAVSNVAQNIFTVPADKRFFCFHRTTNSHPLFAPPSFYLNFSNDSGGAITFSVFHLTTDKPTANDDTQLLVATVNNAAAGNPLIPSIFDQGDSLQLLSSSATAGQQANITVFETKRSDNV